MLLEDLVWTNHFCPASGDFSDVAPIFDSILEKNKDLAAFVVSPDLFYFIRNWARGSDFDLETSSENLRKSLVCQYKGWPIYATIKTLEKDPSEPNKVYKLVS
jgi:hypothetical protein